MKKFEGLIKITISITNDDYIKAFYNKTSDKEKKKDIKQELVNMCAFIRDYEDVPHVTPFQKKARLIKFKEIPCRMMQNKKYTRNELIKICKDSVVHHTKWKNRDSFISQMGIKSIYKGLTAGLKFRIMGNKEDGDCRTDEGTIWLEFIKPINLNLLKRGLDLNISSIEEYFNECDPLHKTEMFNGQVIDFESDYLRGYMPTRKWLETVGLGNDWS